MHCFYRFCDPHPLPSSLASMLNASFSCNIFGQMLRNRNISIMNTSLMNLNDICIYVCDFVYNIHTFEIYVIVFALYPLTHNGYHSVHAFLRKLLHKKCFKFFWD